MLGRADRLCPAISRRSLAASVERSKLANPSPSNHAMKLRTGSATNRIMMVASMCLLIWGCSAFGPRLQDYAFSYEFRRGNQHVAVLAYKLWAEDVVIAYFEPNANRSKSYVESISPRAIGPIPQFLYVKWIDESNNEIHEDTADLRPHMPGQLVHDVIYFTLAGNRLQVYLADLEGRATSPPSQLSPYATLDATTLYSSAVGGRTSTSTGPAEPRK